MSLCKSEVSGNNIIIQGSLEKLDHLELGRRREVEREGIGR